VWDAGAVATTENTMRFNNWLVSRCMFLLISALVSAACSKEEAPSDADAVAELLALSPAETRALAFVDVAELVADKSPAELDELLKGEATDPALRAPLQSVEHLALSLSLSSDIERLLLVQTTAVSNGLALIAKLKADRLDALDTSSLTAQAPYAGVDVFEDKKRQVRVAVLPKGIVVAAQGTGLEAVLDVHAGKASALAKTDKLGPYLAALKGSSTIEFVSALPGMYSKISPLGPGEATLRNAKVLSGALKVVDAKVSGNLTVHADNAEAFVARFNEIQGKTPAISLKLAPPVQSGAPAGAVLAFEDSPLQKNAEMLLSSRYAFKQLFHGMDAVDYTDGVEVDGNLPWLHFDVGGPPNSIFVNFAMLPDQVAAFEAAELSAGFKLAPVRILESDEPTYFLVLNIYIAGGGLVEGPRAEWSVFIKDPADGQTRFMVVQAAAGSASADPVNLVTAPEPVTHELKDGRIVSRVGFVEGDTERNYWTSSIVWPQPVETPAVSAREFVAANDYIFWPNGVADRGLYNASVHNRDAVLIANSDIEIQDDSRWTRYIESTPRHSYVYTTPLDIVVSPWWNLDADYIDATPEHLEMLREFHIGFYPKLVRNTAQAALRGEDSALVGYEIGNKVPTAHFNFVVTDPTALSERIKLPAGYELTKLQLLPSDKTAESYLTLKVYQVERAPEGVRAEWLVYVRNGEGQLESMVIETATTEAAIDPVRFLSLPSLVKHEVTGSALKTTLSGPFLRLDATLDLSKGSSVLPSLDWVETHDYVCHLNGVCDKQFYDGSTLEEPVALLDAASVTLSNVTTPWDGLIETAPRSVFTRNNAQEFAGNPWVNVKP